MTRLEARSPVEKLNQLQLTLNQCIQTQTQLSSLYRQLLGGKHKRSNQQAQEIWQQNVQLKTDAHMEGLQRTISELNSLSDELKHVKRQEKVLRSLQFSEIRRRQGDIRKAHEKTLEWIFDEKTTGFVNWLHKGQGVYWVNGLVSICLRVCKHHLSQLAI